MLRVLSFAALAGVAFLVAGEEVEAASCMKIEVPAPGGGQTPLEMRVPNNAIAAFEARGFAQVSCPAGEIYTAERAEIACQKLAAYPTEAKEAVSQIYGVTTAEICAQARAAEAEGG